MAKVALLLPFPFIFLLLLAPPSFAQVKKPVKPAFPEYHKYANWRSRIKVDPYKQDTLMHPIPIWRASFHDRIDKEQLAADGADGKTDTFITFKADTTISDTLTQALLYNVDAMQVLIENMPPEGRDSLTQNQQKIRYLRAVWEMLRSYNNDPTPDPAFYIALADNMDSMLVAINKHKLMDFARAYPNVYTLYNSKGLFENPSPERAYVYEQMGKSDPVMMIKRLPEYAADTFAGDIIAAAARQAPDVVFDYATSSNIRIKSAVYRTDDPLVQAIVKIASDSKSPPKIFPFLSDVYYRRSTVAQLDSIAAQPNLYFEQLVRLKMENDSIGRRLYNQEIAYRALTYFVRPMNELHEEKDEVRFRCIDSLPPVSLYYIMVYGQDEIYTSSFLGTFRRMMERMAPMKGNQLIDTLHYDRFRTFIRMCAGYNTLSDFLATMDDTAKDGLMTRFIGGLDQGKENELEDAVDVADAFGSIRDSALSEFLEKKVKKNYERSYTEQSKKGMIVYSLLARLFEGNKVSGNDTGASVISSRLHIPPINKVLFSSLANDSGIVYQQVFFFGDKDGQDSYNSYMAEFKNDNKWKIQEQKYWTVLSSVTGRKIVIYANLPLDEPADEDAQDSLCKYLKDSGIHATIMIHRGHSYHLPATLAKLDTNVKIVILGSCGGYHNLALVLDHAPDAHIISSKQTGVRAVNEPIIRALDERLLAGADIDWIAMWQELDEYFLKKPDEQDKFSDYVPPYKNLGAIFIKAYRRMMSHP
jgi:hypothetical protein